MRRSKTNLVAAAALLVAVFALLGYGYTQRFHVQIPLLNSNSPTMEVIVPQGEKLTRTEIEGFLKDNCLVWKPPSKPPGISDAKFKKHEPFSVFAYNEASSCESNDRQVDLVEVDERENLPYNLHHLLSNFLKDSKLEGYAKEIAPILDAHLEAELQTNSTELFWYRFSGNAVWLKDHKVHMLVSRLILAEKRDRQSPTLSLTMAQLFDENWKELEDVTLIFPTGEQSDPDAPVFTKDGKTYSSMKFPLILPIPFTHDYGKTSKYFGAEDPRTLLIKNPDGYEEPAVVFNSLHMDEEGNEFRSMFLALPFQLQKGKKSDPKCMNSWYSKTKEIRLDGDRPKVCKNWTPMVSEKLREKHSGSDSEIYFVTRLDNLRVLKCDVYSDKTCVTEYEHEGRFGDLRGGTSFISLNALLKDKVSEKITELLPSNREVFVGLMRAHLKNCGCGGDFYRPNLVTIVSEETEQGRDFHIAQVSSSISFGITMDPWDLTYEGNLCGKINPLIPNGLGRWNFDTIENIENQWSTDDRLTLFISIMDKSVERIDIKGLLQAILRDNAIFYGPGESEPSADKLEWSFNQNNVACAMDASRKFCSAYGEAERQSTKEVPDRSAEIQEQDRKLKEFETIFGST